MYAPQPQPQPAQHWAGHGHPHHGPAQYRPQEQLQSPQNSQYDHYKHPLPQYQPQLQHPQQLPSPPQLRPDRPEMAAIQPHYHPQGHDCRLPPVQPQQYYQPASAQDYRQHQAPAQAVSQSAPRQRTAIACKYCRRRKIRCSGFDNSEDGRCTNCARFNQECIFTPVSAQTQAFVPAQALYNANNRRAAPGAAAPPTQLYGSYGQPLPPREQYAETPKPVQPQGTERTTPSPSSAYPPEDQRYTPRYPPIEPAYSRDFAYPEPVQNRRRKNEEPHTPVAPPPQNPGYTSDLGRREEERRPSTYAHSVPLPRYAQSDITPPISSTTTSPPYPSYHTNSEPLRRTSTTLSSISSDYPRTSFGSRQSHSPPDQPYYNTTSHIRHGPPPPPHPMTNHSSSNSIASSVHAPRSANELTPPTPHTPAHHAEVVSKPANPMSISGLIDGGSTRSAADMSMVSALNRPRGL